MKKRMPVTDEVRDGVINGIHNYSREENYCRPEDQAVRDKLEWFRDQKFGLMIHFGLYAQTGLVESWSLSDHDASWSRKGLEWAKDGEEFRKAYFGLNRSFNPIGFDPQGWADIAEDAGFRYLIMTTKHHDGFCLWDTDETDYKSTGAECPFHTHPKADIIRHVFNAFRAKGMGIGAYFSKPDWHSKYFWTPGMEYSSRIWRGPTYDVYEYPYLWERFVQFTHRQIKELVCGYGPVDILWLDGGWVNPAIGLDIRLSELAAQLRRYQPGLITVDRTVGGENENYITPEGTVPDKPMQVPWESCVTMGSFFGYKYDDTYMSAEQVIRLLLDVVCKGGNLALNVAPRPDGQFPSAAGDTLRTVGRWMRRYGEAVYGSRIVAPYRTEHAAFVQKGGVVYAFLLADEAGCLPDTVALPCEKKPQKITAMRNGAEVPFSMADGTAAVQASVLPRDEDIPAVIALKLEV